MGVAVIDAKLPSSDLVENTLRAGRRGRRWRWLAWLVVLALVASGLGYWLTRPPPVQSWQTVPVDRGDLVTTVTATGTLEPRRSITVGAEVSGRIASVEVEENQVVHAGDVLARFETETLESSLATAQASLDVARASVKRAQASRDEAKAAEKRQKALVDAKTAAPSALESATATRLRADAEVSSSQAQVRQAEAELARAQTNLDKAVISSPVDGVVLLRNVEPGATVAASFQSPELFVLAEDLSKMKLELAIDEADVGLVAPKQLASFTVDAWPERSFAGEVERVRLYPSSTDNVVTYTTTLSVDNRDGLLRPGMTATATITTGTHANVLRVPSAALRFSPPKEESQGVGMPRPPGADSDESDGPSNTVYVLREGEPVRVVLSLGSSDGRYSEVLSGELKVGDELVIGVATAVPGGAP